jgi:hypothetical protein
MILLEKECFAPKRSEIPAHYRWVACLFTFLYVCNVCSFIIMHGCTCTYTCSLKKSKQCISRQSGAKYARVTGGLLVLHFCTFCNLCSFMYFCAFAMHVPRLQCMFLYNHACVYLYICVLTPARNPRNAFRAKSDRKSRAQQAKISYCDETVFLNL